jgi:protein RecA
MFGNPETTTGGMALKFYASVRLDVRRVESIKVGQEVVGSRVRARVVKNKVAPPFRVAEFDTMYNEGISRAGGILDLGVEAGLVEKRGSFYTYGENRIGQRRTPRVKEELDGSGVGKEIMPAPVVSGVWPQLEQNRHGGSDGDQRRRTSGRSITHLMRSAAPRRLVY